MNVCGYRLVRQLGVRSFPQNSRNDPSISRMTPAMSSATPRGRQTRVFTLNTPEGIPMPAGVGLWVVIRLAHSPQPMPSRPRPMKVPAGKLAEIDATTASPPVTATTLYQASGFNPFTPSSIAISNAANQPPLPSPQPPPTPPPTTYRAA